MKGGTESGNGEGLPPSLLRITLINFTLSGNLGEHERNDVIIPGIAAHRRYEIDARLARINGHVP